MKITGNTILLAVIVGVVLLVGIVDGDAVNPPNNVKICGYVSHCSEIGIWWGNSTSTDYDSVQIWFDGDYITQTNATFYTNHTDVVGNHTISTHAVDTFGNVNPAWSNWTVELATCPECKEGWYCDDDEYCAMPETTPTPTTTVTVTPTSWVNQTFNPVTDICTIRADMGETWIKWDATCNTTVEVLYYIDGVKLENTPPYGKLDPERLILSDLHNQETHNLKIYYLGNIVAESTVTTLPSWYMLLFFIILSLSLSITGLLFINSPIIRIILAGLAFSIAAVMMTMTTGWMLALPVIPALIAGLVIILALYDQVHTSWGN